LVAEEHAGFGGTRIACLLAEEFLHVGADPRYA
jgi:hypothetical protein